jgi:hypothetical protein
MGVNSSGNFFLNAAGNTPLTITSGAPDNVMYINDSGYLGIGTSVPSMRLDVNGNATIRNGYGLNIGSPTQYAPAGTTPELQVQGTAGGDAGIGIGRYSADAYGPNLLMWKSRAAAIGTDTIVQDGDSLGMITWAAADGTDINSYSASIHAEIDGTPGSNDVPGALVFKTTADGESTTTERARFTAAGNFTVDTNVLYVDAVNNRVGVGTAAPGVRFVVNASGGDPSSIAADTLAIFNNSAAAGCVSRVSIVGGATGNSILDFGDTAATNAGYIIYDHTNNNMGFDVGGTDYLFLLGGGGLVRGTSCPICVEGGMYAGIQNHATGAANSGVMNVRWQNSTGGPSQNLFHHPLRMQRNQEHHPL